MSQKLTLSIGLVVLASLGCGSSSHSADEIDMVDFTQANGVFQVRYEFEKDLCDTQAHSVTGASREEAIANFCGDLADDDLNRNCANDLRQKHFKEYCTNFDADGDHKKGRAEEGSVVRHFGDLGDVTLHGGDDLH